MVVLAAACSGWSGSGGGGAAAGCGVRGVGLDL